MNAFQNYMMYTHSSPSAGPTGGAGLAWPPGIWSLMSVRTFFAICLVCSFLDERAKLVRQSIFFTWSKLSSTGTWRSKMSTSTFSFC